MAMNKSELRAMEQLKYELLLAKALRFTEEIRPDVIPPKESGKLSKGWLFLGYDTPHVVEGCSSSHYHSTSSTVKTDAQGSRDLYSTKLLALKAARNQVERFCAERLAKIDKLIAEEITGGQGDADNEC